MPDSRAAVETVFREESGRIIASLIRFSGSFDLAEEAMQDALARALAVWPAEGIPENPAAWIMTAARRKLIDAARRAAVRREKGGILARESSGSIPGPGDHSDMNFPDDRLRLIFTCCHPALNPDAQVALTLRTLGGLSTAEIARAFLVPEATLAQRLVRVKRKIQDAHIPYEVPSPERLPERLAAVQSVVYLIFNEGYSATTGDRLVRADICAEAIRLGRILLDLMPREAENAGLLALMLLQDSRALARTSTEGRLVTLEEQDRSLWKREQISEGLDLVERALKMRSPGPYQIQAAIAAVHSQADSAGSTDWAQIVRLYRELLRFQNSPVVKLNYAAAVAMAEGEDRGLQLIEEIDASGELDRYYLLHAARADLLRRLGRGREAEVSYRRALDLATNPVERDYLNGRIEEIAAV